jgi:hypothetical protein
MRPVALLIAVIALFAVPASLASASGRPTRAPVPDAANTATFVAGQACPFAVHIEPVVNREYTLTFPAEPNGDVVQMVSGYLLERFTNLDSGKSIVLNNSSQATVVSHTDGSATIDVSGPVALFFLAPFHAVPSAYVNYGHVVLDVSPPFGLLTLVSQTGRQLDICSALS